MPIVVVALPQAEFDAWTRQQLADSQDQQQDTERLWTRQELMQHGESVYANACASCHQAQGQGLAPAFPALAGSEIATGPVDAHIDIVMNGRAGTAMSAWREKLSETDIAAALTYTRNAFGNDTGDVVQPLTIANIKRQNTEQETAP
jgi:cytochrome c oxidase subunit 2